MDEHQRAGALGRSPEGLEAGVAQVRAGDAGGDLDAREGARAHQLLELASGQLGVLERHRPEHADPVRTLAAQARQAVVL